MTKTVMAYSLEPPRYVSQFLLRELHVLWNQVSSEELCDLVQAKAAHGICSTIIVHDADLYFDVFKRAPDQSLVLIVLFDESYSESMLKICRLSSVYSIYRFFGIETIRLNTFVYLMRYLADNGLSSLGARKFLEEVKLRKDLAPRLKRWRELEARVSIICSPYSDGFAKHVSAERELSHDQSLVLMAEKSLSVSRTPSLLLSFMGTLHHAQRYAAIRANRSVQDSSFVIRQGWSGESSDIQVGRYVRLLRNSAFTLAPPGYICNETFRSTEALICGSIPISLRTNLSQSVKSLGVDTPGLVGTSWRHLRRDFLSLSHEERYEVVARALREFLETTARLRASIYADSTKALVV